MTNLEGIYREPEFRQTAIGSIPSNWNVVRLGDVCEIIGGGTPSTSIKKYWNGKIPFVTPTDVTELEDRNINFLGVAKNNVTEEGLKNSSARLLPPGSILLTSRATIGCAVINEVPVATNQGFASLICSKKVHDIWILYLMRYMRRKLERLAAGSTFKEISRGTIRNLSIPFPTYAEQEKIGGVLSLADDAIQKTNEIIAKTERLKKGLMQDLLTKGIGYKEFKDSKIGRIPKEWQAVRLGDIGEFQYGITASASDEDTGVRLLRITDITNEGVEWEKVPYCRVTKTEFRKYLLGIGDVLIARIGATTGKSCYVDQPINGVFGSYLLRFRPKVKLVTKFVYYYTQSSGYWTQINKKKAGQLKKGLNITTLGSLLLPFPALTEQQRIVESLSTVDKKLRLERSEKAELERTKRALMDLLLIGKIRIKVG